MNTDLINSELIGKTFISRVYYFDELGSTNDYARKLKGENDILVITDYQFAGRGRFERKWETEKGKNLTFTIRKQSGLGIENSNYINFFFSYCLYLSLKIFLEKSFPEKNTYELEIKWPNDILLDSKKICGILIESISNGRDYLIGIGINVNQNNFSSLPGAGSLSLFTGSEIGRSKLLIQIIKEIDNNLQMMETGNLNKIYELWKSSTKMIGKYAEIEFEGETHKSIQIINLHQDGTIELLLKGSKKRFTNGELSIKGLTA